MYSFFTNRWWILFYIYMIPGTVTLKKQLDYESNHEVSFTVIATDSASPPSSVLTSTATVSVSLIDINDNTPQFLPHPTQYSVEENAPNGTFVGNITATDRDSGRFGEITYSLQVTNDDQSLTIDSKTVCSLLFCPKHPVNLNSIYLTMIFLVINTWLSIP